MLHTDWVPKATQPIQQYMYELDRHAHKFRTTVVVGPLLTSAAFTVLFGFN